jgi:HAD superfamily 5'-nucleotidase-like hydrolase
MRRAAALAFAVCAPVPARSRRVAAAAAAALRPDRSDDWRGSRSGRDSNSNSFARAQRRTASSRRPHHHRQGLAVRACAQSGGDMTSAAANEATNAAAAAASNDASSSDKTKSSTLSESPTTMFARSDAETTKTRTRRRATGAAGPILGAGPGTKHAPGYTSGDATSNGRNKASKVGQWNATGYGDNDDMSLDTAADADDAGYAPADGPRYRYRGEIFCNRALNMARIAAVGFDMDYTLAQYYSEKFESLSAKGAIDKLVYKLGYPEQLLKLEYDHSYFIRGLVVDKVRGNMLKLDRHKYVKSALHGFRAMSKQERTIYDQITVSGGGFLEPQYALLDTIFSLPDAFLFSALVQYKDDNPESIAQDYAQIYKDVRRSVDMCHRDGSIKDVVAANPEQYIQNDPGMFDMLNSLRASGRKVFLLTNSFADYTDTVMSYLYRSAGHGDGSDWQDVFDVIITGSCKPAYIVDKYRPLYRCDVKTGLLTNTEGPYEETPEQYLARGKSFQGGNYTHLHNILGVSNGTQVLYVGDHIYSDIVRSKRTLGWRTMLIIPELEHEVNHLNHPETRALSSAIDEKRLKRDELDEWIDSLERELVSQPSELTPERRAKIIEERDLARMEMEAMRGDIISDVEKLHKRFHPVWGQLFKSGPQNSRFAEQVENYACLYTSKVTNIQHVSPEFYWRSMPDLMPHDRFHSTPMHRMIETRKRRTSDAGSD